MHTSLIPLSIVGWLTISIASAWCQSPLTFYPYAQGNVLQYRDASTQEIVYRKYFDSVWIGPDSSIYILSRYVAGQTVFEIERIDTSFDLFVVTWQPDHPRYKFAADSGATWFAGYDPGDSSRHYEVTLSDIFEGYVFNVLTTIKEYTFHMIQFDGTDTLELGKEYLAAGFGLVFALIEGGSAPYLSGAIIDGVQWGEPIVGVKETPSKPPQFSLHQNYPNPFNPLTNITFDLPQAVHVQLSVFDLLGRSVATLLDERREAGHHVVQFDGSGIASGTLFYRLEAGMYAQTRRMILMK